jgi:hypothetical protein
VHSIPVGMGSRTMLLVPFRQKEYTNCLRNIYISRKIEAAIMDGGEKMVRRPCIYTQEQFINSRTGYAGGIQFLTDSFHQVKCTKF